MEISDDVGFNKSVIKKRESVERKFPAFSSLAAILNFLLFILFVLFSFLFFSKSHDYLLFIKYKFNSLLYNYVSNRCCILFLFSFAIIYIKSIFYYYFFSFLHISRSFPDYWECLLTQTATSTSAAIINVF